MYVHSANNSVAIRQPNYTYPTYLTFLMGKEGWNKCSRRICLCCPLYHCYCYCFCLCCCYSALCAYTQKIEMVFAQTTALTMEVELFHMKIQKACTIFTGSTAIRCWIWFFSILSYTLCDFFTLSDCSIALQEIKNCGKMETLSTKWIWIEAYRKNQWYEYVC